MKPHAAMRSQAAELRHFLRAAVLAVLLAFAPTVVYAQPAGPVRDLELTGAVIGPLPLRPDVGSQFAIRIRNLGPNATGPQTQIISLWPLDGPRVLMTYRSEPPCYAYTQTDLGTPSPPNYFLEIRIEQVIPPGGAVTCFFEMTTTSELPLDATIRFDAYNGFFVYGADPDISNNTVVFGIGPRSPAVVVGPAREWLLLLAVALGVAAAFRPRLRNSPDQKSDRPPPFRRAE